MDLKTGFRTRSILCQPVRGMRGGGAIIGVIQMLNKIGGDGTFDINDEDMLATFAGKVADMLSVRFTDLANIAEKFSGGILFYVADTALQMFAFAIFFVCFCLCYVVDESCVGHGMFVGAKGGNFGEKHSYAAPTASSSKNSRPTSSVDQKAEPDHKDE